jgi:hypothetical protein
VAVSGSSGNHWKNYPLPNGARIAAGFILVLAIFSFFSISFALLVFFMTPALRNAQQNYLFLSLLVTCLVMVVNTIVIQSYSTITNSWGFLLGNQCKATGFIIQTASGLEAFSLMCIAIERYFIIIKERALSKTEVIAMLVIGWFVCFFITRSDFIFI